MLFQYEEIDSEQFLLNSKRFQIILQHIYHNFYSVKTTCGCLARRRDPRQKRRGLKPEDRRDAHVNSSALTHLRFFVLLRAGQDV